MGRIAIIDRPSISGSGTQARIGKVSDNERRIVIADPDTTYMLFRIMK